MSYPVHAYQVKTSRISGYEVLTFSGEGELKIVEELLFNVNNSRGQQETHLIVGQDSDLFLLGMRHSSAISWNGAHFVLGMVANVKNLSILSGKCLFNVDKLSQSITKSLKQRDRTKNTSVALDLAMLCFWSGNDYLPKIRECVHCKFCFRIWIKILVRQYPSFGTFTEESVKEDLEVLSLRISP